MHFQVARVFELLVTIRTDEWLFIFVNRTMHIHFAFSFELLVALGTSEWLFTNVNSTMHNWTLSLNVNSRMYIQLAFFCFNFLSQSGQANSFYPVNITIQGLLCLNTFVCHTQDKLGLTAFHEAHLSWVNENRNTSTMHNKNLVHKRPSTNSLYIMSNFKHSVRVRVRFSFTFNHTQNVHF